MASVLLSAAAAGAPIRAVGAPIRGLVAPVFTAFNESGALDLGRIEQQAGWLSKAGVEWVFTAGSTGESVDLTVAERKSIAEQWISVAPKFGLSVIVHVGTDSISDAKDMAAHAEAHGADAIAAMPPTYIRPSTLDALVATVAATANAAPNTPFYYYHIPSKTYVDFPVADLVAAADAAVPTFRGVKFTHYALDDFQLASSFTFTKGAAWRVGQPPNMMFGRDQFLLAAAAYGCEAAVGTTYNFNAELQSHVFGTDLAKARRAQFATASFIKMLETFDAKWGGVYTWKMIMELAGMPVGPPRLPYLLPTPQVTAALKTALIEWCTSTDGDLRPSWCKAL